MLRAPVSNIQKSCVHDGPGIRTVVFLMGCPLRCRWCHNPENFEARPVVMYDPEKCVACGRCVLRCANHCMALENGTLVYNRAGCIACGQCADACLMDAKSLCGQYQTSEAVFDAVMDDQVFYRNSGGGVTLSGGEPTMYPDFSQDLFSRLHEAGIHTAMETCGYCSEETIHRMAKVTDLFLYDVKFCSESLHLRWTGKSNAPILRNLRLLHDAGKEIIVRIPLVPGVNDGEEFHQIMRHLQSMPALRRVHIMPFHQVGASKYILSGRPYLLEAMPECPAELAQRYAEIAQHYGFRVNIGGWDSQ